MRLTAWSQTIKQLKIAILASRYKAAVLANNELLTLYFNVGKLITEREKKGKWGDKILEQLSNDLQHELPGLKGFSASNIKRMRLFYQQWNDCFVIGPLPTDQLQNRDKKPANSRTFLISPLPTDQLKKSIKKDTVSNKLLPGKLATDQIRPLLTDQFAAAFFLVSFTHHVELLTKTNTLEERQFYIGKIATEFWTVDTLQYHLKNKLFRKKGKMPYNFSTAITNENLRAKALQSFKDEYLLDFINIQDPDEEDERQIENEIVRNIKKFLMSLGADFAFISNQYRLIVDDIEYFADLLFFNRKLQCLVAFDLKKGKFKPEYAGKMNFYLSALDEYIKQPHEMPAIGIILCKEKSNKTVEFSFRDMHKPMGAPTKQGVSYQSNLKMLYQQQKHLKN